MSAAVQPEPEAPEWSIALDASAMLAPITEDDRLNPTIVRRPMPTVATLTISHKGRPVLTASVDSLTITSTPDYPNPNEAIAALIEAANRPDPEGR
jgi:hypothetical protein